MRIVLQGKTNVNDVGNSILDALNQTMDIIDSENPDLIKELQINVIGINVNSVVVDLEFELADKEEPLMLVTDADEVLTFKYTVDNDKVSLEGNNVEEPIFSDTDRAIVDLSEGLQEVKPQLDTSGLSIIYATEVAGLNIQVYENGFVQYYKEGKLVQEATVAPEKLNSFIESIEDIINGNNK